MGGVKTSGSLMPRFANLNDNFSNLNIFIFETDSEFPVHQVGVVLYVLVAMPSVNVNKTFSIVNDAYAK